MIKFDRAAFNRGVLTVATLAPIRGALAGVVYDTRIQVARLIMWCAYWITPPGCGFRLGLKRGFKSYLQRDLDRPTS